MVPRFSTVGAQLHGWYFLDLKTRHALELPAKRRSFSAINDLVIEIVRIKLRSRAYDYFLCMAS